MKKILTTTLLCLSVALFSAQDISVETQVDQREITIGDVIRYSIVLSHAPGVEIILPPLAANLGQFEIRDYQVHEPYQQDDQVIEKTDYLISTFETGEFEIPPLQIGYRLAGDSTVYQLNTKAIDIRVKSLNPDEAGDIRDIKAPLEPGRSYRRFILAGALALLVLLAGGILYYFIKRRRAGQSLLPAFRKPPRPIHEVTLEALEDLRQRDYLSRGEIKLYYSELSDIVRHYIAGRYFINAMEMTTRELVADMEREDLPQETTSRIDHLLSLSDLVKFAKLTPPDDQSREALELAIAFVHDTKIVAEPSETVQENENSTNADPVQKPEKAGEVI